MNKISYKQIMGFDPKPCYNPKEIGMPEDYEATLVEFIQEYRQKVKKTRDILWVVCREELIDAKTLRLFAVFCARDSFNYVTNVDERSITAVDVAERFANSEATKEELVAACSAARSAACSAAYSAAYSAARSAAYSAAYSAADSAAWSAARSAAYSAADSAADSAAYSAARSAAYSAAYSEARSEACNKYINKLIDFLNILEEANSI